MHQKVKSNVSLKLKFSKIRLSDKSLYAEKKFLYLVILLHPVLYFLNCSGRTLNSDRN